MAFRGVGSRAPPAGHVSDFHKHSEEGLKGFQAPGHNQRDYQAQNLSSLVPLSCSILPAPQKPTWAHLSFFCKFIYFKLEDNCFTILYWFLPYINMNQP